MTALVVIGLLASGVGAMRLEVRLLERDVGLITHLAIFYLAVGLLTAAVAVGCVGL